MAQISDVLTKLLERSKQGKVRWQSTAAEQAFVAVIGNTSVMIRVDYYGDPILKILDKTGSEIEVLNGGVEPEGKRWRQALNELHQLARRQALKTHDQLDELLRELDKVDA